MEQLRDLLAPLSDRHREALTWFLDRTGTEQGWPESIKGPFGETFLATKAKGIYKPNWTTYALSVRQTLGGPYPDQEPVMREDGSWLYSYFQENEDPQARDQEFTNLGLLACMKEKVPIGVMRQTRGRPSIRYKILGLALVTGWDGGYFFLEGFSPTGLAQGKGPKSEIDILQQREIEKSVSAQDFEPQNIIDSRERAVAQIVRRRGQPSFRRGIIEAYEGKCAISECDAVEALEAAHISPYLGTGTNVLENGLLLRADLHTLFDLGLLAVHEASLEIIVAPVLMATVYKDFAGRRLRSPKNPGAMPNAAALKLHREWCGL